MEDFKEDMNKSINETHENTNRQWNAMKETAQDMEVKAESIKLRQD